MPDENKLAVIEADHTSKAIAERRVSFEKQYVVASEEYRYSWRYLVHNLLYQRPSESNDLIRETADEKGVLSTNIIGICIEKDNLLHRLSALAEQAKIFADHNRIVPLFIGEKEYIREQQAADINKALELPKDHPAYQYAQIHIKKFTPSEEKHKPFYPEKALLPEVGDIVEMFAGAGWVEENSRASESRLMRLHSACDEFKIAILTKDTPPLALWTKIVAQIPMILEAARFTTEKYRNYPEFKDFWKKYVENNKDLINRCLAFMQKIRPTSLPPLQNNWPTSEIPKNCDTVDDNLKQFAQGIFTNNKNNSESIEFLLECQDALLFLELDERVFSTLEDLIFMCHEGMRHKDTGIALIDRCIGLIPFLEKNYLTCVQQINDCGPLYYCSTNFVQNRWFTLFSVLAKQNLAMDEELTRSILRPLVWGLLNHCSVENLYGADIDKFILWLLKHSDEEMVKALLKKKDWNQYVAEIAPRFKRQDPDDDKHTNLFEVALKKPAQPHPEYELSILALASLMNPSICEQLINNTPKESQAKNLAGALTGLNYFHNTCGLENKSLNAFRKQPRKACWLHARYWPGMSYQIEFSSEISIQARLTLLLNLEAYPEFKDYEYTRGDKRILQDYMCHVISSIENVEDVCKFYDKQEQHKYWDYRRHAIFDRVRSACKSALFNDQDEGSDLKQRVTQACKQRIQELHKQDPYAVLSEHTEKHLLFKKDAPSHSSNPTQKADDLSRRMLLRP